MKAYNKAYDKSIKNPSFYKMINDETMKYKVLQDMLDSIGYEIVFRRKRDADQWICFSKFNCIQWIDAAEWINGSQWISDVSNEITINI